jgi:hypothetical protein
VNSAILFAMREAVSRDIGFQTMRRMLPIGIAVATETTQPERSVPLPSDQVKISNRP